MGPRVNNLKTYGRWDFVEFSDVFAIEGAFGDLVDRLAQRREAAE